MGSKWAHSTCLCTPNSPQTSLERHILDPFFAHFWPQNNPFSKHFVTLEGPKWLARGLKRAHFTCLCTTNGRGFLEKHIFFTHFLVTKQPIFKEFSTLGGGGQNGFQWAPLTPTMTSDQRSLNAGKKRDLSKCPGLILMREEAEKNTRKPRKPVAIVRRRGGGGTVPQSCVPCVHPWQGGAGLDSQSRHRLATIMSGR